jgi:cobalt-zinc-cadmium efflux system membrane fusion protein
MKTTLRLLLLLSVASCSAPPPEERDGRSHRDSPGAPEAARLEDGRVHIAPTMLRDLRLTTAPAETRPSADGISMLGELRPNLDAYAEVSVPIPARVTRLRVAPGAHVRAGDRLADLESVELGRARADLITSQARLDLARQVAARKRLLEQERIAPRREVEEAEMELAAAEAERGAAAGALRAIGIEEGDEVEAEFALRAPITGTVLDRQAVLGQRVTPADPLFRIGDLSTVWLMLHAFEQDAVRVRTGGVARVTLTALPGRSFEGRIARVAGEVDSVSRTVPVRVEIANPEALLRPGMSAKAWLPLGGPGSPIVTVPTAALQRLRDDWVVFVPQGKDTFEIRAVARGRDLGGEIEIVHGLAPGETLVVEGAFLLKAEADKDHGEGGHDHD